MGDQRAARAAAAPGPATVSDPRHIANGWNIPSEGYADQPYIVQTDDGETVYRRCSPEHHHHLVCRSCGRTEDVCCAVGAAPCLTAHSHHGFQIDEAEVIYWGTCPACLKKKR